MEKVVITGASGFIGSALSKRLLENDVKVYGVGRWKLHTHTHTERERERERERDHKLTLLKSYGDFHPIVADFNEYDRLYQKIPGYDFDAFYHLAWDGVQNSAYNNVETQIKNLQGSIGAVQSMVKISCNRSFYSSSYYKHAVNMSQDNREITSSVYGTIKGMADYIFKLIAHQNNTPYKSMVIPNAYGAGSKNSMEFFITKLLKNQPLDLVPENTLIDFIWIDDLIDGILAVQTAKKPYAEYYMGHRQITTFGEKIQLMKEALNSTSELRFGTYPLANTVDFSKINLNALYDETGFEPKTDFKESIVKTAESILRNNSK
jgi:nucleoside-diphosphate-sugar epimerase